MEHLPSRPGWRLRAVAAGLGLACACSSGDAGTGRGHDGGRPADAPSGAQPDAAVPDAAVPDAEAPDAEAGPNTIGEPCQGDPMEGMELPEAFVQGTCSQGEVCLPVGFVLPDGYCSRVCTPGAAGACPQGTRCYLQLSETDALCMRTCETCGDCRPGYLCAPMRGEDVCMVAPLFPSDERGNPPDLPLGTGPDCGPCLDPAGVSPVPDGFSANVPVSAGDSVFEAENYLAADPAGNLLVVYMALSGEFGGGSPSILVGVSRSTDGGSTFERLPDLPAPVGEQMADPVVAADSQGRFYVVYITQPPNVGGWLQWTDDLGDTFSEPVRFDGEARGYNIDRPWLAVDAEDRVWFVWTRVRDEEGSVGFARRSDDRGETFTDPVQVTVGAPDQDRLEDQGTALSPAIGPDGRLWVSYLRQPLPADRWGSPYSHVFLTVSHDDGAGFADGRQVDSVADWFAFSNTPVAVDSQGRAYVTYLVGLPDGAWDVSVARSRENDPRIEARAIVHEDAGCASFNLPWIAVDPADRVHVVWIDNRYGWGAVRHSLSDDAGESWRETGFVSDATFDYAVGQRALDWLGDYFGAIVAGDRLLVAWADPRDGASHVYFSAADLDGF